MSYVDSFVVPVPNKNFPAYRRLSNVMQKVWLEHGALDYQEFAGDDAKPGKITSFPQSVKLKDDETVVIGFITYKSRAERDRINAEAMKDERMVGMQDPKSLPFDGMRMFMGGFKPIDKA